jgi:hypothetical protein
MAERHRGSRSAIEHNYARVLPATPARTFTLIFMRITSFRLQLRTHVRTTFDASNNPLCFITVS